MISSLATNTVKQYNTTFKLWWNYCLKNHLNYLEASKAAVILFLTKQYESGASYGTLNSHRSAISLLLGNNIGSDEQVSRLLKGVFKCRPSIPKYNTVWNPQVVLDFMENLFPHTDLTLSQISKKLATLLALCTASRVQTLSLIKTNCIVIHQEQIIITITNLIKTSAVNREQPTLVIPYFTDKPSICPAKCLEDYLEITKNIRNDSSNLFLTYKRPHKPVTSQTISRWIKNMLAESGVDVTRFSAHSTRHAAASTAHAAGVSLDAIRKTAGWTATSQTFAKFYNRPIISQELARSVIETNN
ncbi:hypothetical protein ABMA27_000971 [Loxostege sticticalis]|uniref:Tyr recombinase domain-containing protein n=1 Tax=Loxostege sticticalis TaxID=481309 RepID=A0ABR3I108_LOXSC